MALKVIVVEDKAEVAGQLQGLLRDLGHEVCGVARQAAELAELLKTHDPEIVIIDLDLGERQDGIGVATLLEAAAIIPVVFIVNPDDEEPDIEESRSIEGSARLSRPFERAGLEQAIAQALRRVDWAKSADL